MTARRASPADRLVGAATGVLERRLDRRSLVTKVSLVGAAIATSGLDFVLRPGSAYASVCGEGSSCSSGWTAMCCTIHDGVNQCPPGSFAGGWWKATGAKLCGGKARYYVDCQARCTKCGCGGGHFCARGCANCRSRCADGSCDKRKTCHNLFRYGQCNRHISCSGAIVCRAISCTPPWQWADCSKASATDNATRTHAAACLPVWSSIMKRYTAMGSQRSVLGATVGKEHDAHHGRVQRFQHGRMYWSKAVGAHWLDGALLARYLDVGGSGSSLGLPTADAHATEGGRGLRFEHGGIYQGDGHGAYALWGAGWARWSAHGVYAGPLGYPLSTWAHTPDGTGSYAAFQHGIVADGPHTPACAVWGPAAAKWRGLSRERGPLGYPSVEERPITGSGGRDAVEVRFEHGTVVTVEAQAFALWGPVNDTWRAGGGPSSVWGLPASDLHQTGTAQVCDFENGSITYDVVTGQVTTVP